MPMRRRLAIKRGASGLTSPVGLKVAATFSILLSLAPALAAVAGVVILPQPLTILDAVAITQVVVARMGAVSAASRRRAELAP